MEQNANRNRRSYREEEDWEQGQGYRGESDYGQVGSYGQQERYGSQDYGRRQQDEWRNNPNDPGRRGNMQQGGYGNLNYDQQGRWNEDENQGDYNRRQQGNFGNRSNDYGGPGNWRADNQQYIQGRRSSQYGTYNRDSDNERAFGNVGGYGNNSGRYGREDEFGYGNRGMDSNVDSYYGRSSGSNRDSQWRDMEQGRRSSGSWQGPGNRDTMGSWSSDRGWAQGDDSRSNMQGLHRGKGPKDYQRSDERIREDICDRLCDDPNIDASDIDVKVNHCEVTLTGTVDSKDVKRKAEDLAESISGVQNVQNHLRVGQPDSGSPTGSSASKTKSGSSSAANPIKTEKVQHHHN